MLKRFAVRKVVKLNDLLSMLMAVMLMCICHVESMLF